MVATIVNRRWPPRTPASQGVWNTVYEVDFTDMGSGKNTDWRADGDSASVVLDGGYGDSATWVAHAVSRTQAAIITSASVCRLLHGTGLQIKPASGPNLWQDVTTATKILAQVIDLVAGLTLDDAVCIQMRANADKDPLVVKDGNDIAQFGLYIGALASSQATPEDWAKNVTLLQDLGSGTDLYVSHVQGRTGLLYERTGNTNADFYEIIIYPYKGSTAGTLRMAAGDWGGNWPTPGGTYTATTFANLNRTLTAAGTSTNMGVSALYVGFASSQGDITGGDIPTTTAYQLRVLKLAI